MQTPKALAETIRTELKKLAIPATVQAQRTGAVRIALGKRTERFSISEQEDIRAVAAGLGLHWIAPECGQWPVRADERPTNPEQFTFYGA